MLELLKCKRTVPKSLLMKTICFEKTRELCFENNNLTTPKPNKDEISQLINMTHKLTYIEKNKPGQEKLSEQATTENEPISYDITTPSTVPGSSKSPYDMITSVAKMKPMEENKMDVTNELGNILPQTSQNIQ
jgi:hypothetical protein